MEKLKEGDKISYADPRVIWESEELEEVLKQGQWAEYSLTGTDNLGRTIEGSAQAGHIEPEFDEVEIEEIEGDKMIKKIFIDEPVKRLNEESEIQIPVDNSIRFEIEDNKFLVNFTDHGISIHKTNLKTGLDVIKIIPKFDNQIHIE